MHTPTLSLEDWIANQFRLFKLDTLDDEATDNNTIFWTGYREALDDLKVKLELELDRTGKVWPS